MATLPPKAPPRFVPTLTDVVHVARGDLAPIPLSAPLLEPQDTGEGPSAQRAAEPPPPIAAPPWSPQARWPETTPLSAIVGMPAPAVQAATTPASAAEEQGPTVGPALGPALPDGFEEDLVHRVMQRVDVVLDQRLREAIATVVQEQTRSIVPRLREEVESVVRQAVYEAVADELSGEQPSRM